MLALAPANRNLAVVDIFIFFQSLEPGKVVYVRMKTSTRAPISCVFCRHQRRCPNDLSPVAVRTNERRIASTIRLSNAFPLLFPPFISRRFLVSCKKRSVALKSFAVRLSNIFPFLVPAFVSKRFLVSYLAEGRRSVALKPFTVRSTVKT